jgi:phage terminase large subunit-like protein
MDNGFFANLAETLRDSEANDWSRIGRLSQMLHSEDWWTIQMWLAGRGFGKTLALTQNARTEIEAGRAGYVAAVGASASDCRDILAEGPCGFLAIAPKWNRPVYEPSKRRITWPNGATCTLFSAEEPDALRGPQHDFAICDELAKWKYSTEAFDNLMFGLRLKRPGSSRPRCLIATTPLPIKIIKALLARARTEANPNGDTVVVRGSTLENANNLAPSFINQILERYRGTRLERQEVFGEVLLDVPGALFSLENLENTRVQAAPHDLERVVIGVDPAGSSQEGADETGIIVAARGSDGNGYVLADLSGVMTPLEWATTAVDAYRTFKADLIVAERNFGGEMVAANIASVDPNVPVKLVQSSRGKVLRAEPIASLFAQRRAHLVGSHPALEDQACRFTSEWDRSRDGSPDRVDAMVFALAELVISPGAGAFFDVRALLMPGNEEDLYGC